MSHVRQHGHHNKNAVDCGFAGGSLLYKIPRSSTTTNIVTAACVDQYINRHMRARHGNATHAKRINGLQIARADGLFKLNTFHRADNFDYSANVRNIGRHFERCRKTWKRLEDMLEDVIWPRECFEDVVNYFKIQKF